MPRTRTGKSGKGEPKTMDNAAETKPASAPVQIGVQLSEAYTKLGRSLYDGILDGRKQQSEAAASFTKAKHTLERDTAKRATEAYHEYVKAVQEGATNESAHQLVAEAYQNYAATLAGLQEDAGRRLQELYGEFVAKSSEAAEGAKRQTRQQYVDYLKNVQQIWSSVDVEALVP
jgi:hypothetical protein